MKLNPSTQLGLGFTSEMQSGIVKMQVQNMLRWDVGEELKQTALGEISNLFSDSNNQFYLFRETALVIAERIKLDKGKLEDFSFLRSVKEKKVTYLMGKHLFYRWMKIGDTIFMGCIKTWESNGLSGLNYWLLKINTLTGELIFPEENMDKDFEDMIMRFVRLFVFTELSELETLVLKPKQKSGTRKSGKYINDSTKGVTIIDSTWNKIMIRTQGFAVSGHLRLQRYGAGRQDVKLIYINEFQKSGYIRGAKMETIN